MTISKIEILPDLGRRLSVSALARRLHLSPAWVKQNALALGAVPVGGKFLFFENCIENRLKSLAGDTYAITENQSPRQKNLAGPDNFAQRQAQRENLFHQKRGLGMGDFSQDEINRTLRDLDPEGILPA
jgi:hypothetical protein